jgi:hypothetical protein
MLGTNKNETDISWCRGKSLLVRLPVLVFMFYLLYQNIFNPNYFGFIRYFDLIIHEAGHWIFMPFGETLTILGGSLLQLIIPIIFIFSFWRQNDYFGISFCLVWLGDNLFYVATYIGDARALVLPLLGGDGTIHDWNFLLSKWDILSYDKAIASGVESLGAGAMLGGIAWGGWVLWMIYKNKS